MRRRALALLLCYAPAAQGGFLGGLQKIVPQKIVPQGVTVPGIGKSPEQLAKEVSNGVAKTIPVEVSDAKITGQIADSISSSGIGDTAGSLAGVAQQSVGSALQGLDLDGSALTEQVGEATGQLDLDTVQSSISKEQVAEALREATPQVASAVNRTSLQVADAVMTHSPRVVDLVNKTGHSMADKLDGTARVGVDTQGQPAAERAGAADAPDAADREFSWAPIAVLLVVVLVTGSFVGFHQYRGRRPVVSLLSSDTSLDGLRFSGSARQPGIMADVGQESLFQKF